MVFLRPTIVRSKHDLREISESRYNALRKLDESRAKGKSSRLLPDSALEMFDTRTQDNKRQPAADQP